MHPLLILLLGMTTVIAAILALRLHPFFALILGAALVAGLTSPIDQIGKHIATGFAATCGGVGIVIAMAAVIGKCLLASGGAERIVVAIRGLFGDKRLSPAFASSSFLLGIPAFFDTVFYLLMPIGRATARQSGNYLLLTLSIVAGATMAHSLVPPTPGPLFVADELGISILEMILGGLIVGIITVAAGLAYARWANRRWDIPLRDSDLDKAEDALRPTSKLPSLALSLLPILLPLPLLVGGTVVDAIYGLEKTRDPGTLPLWAQLLEFVGHKNIALTLAALCALLLLARARTGKELSKAVNSALESGGIIILITAAGGSFGYVIREGSGLIEWLKTMSPDGKLLILPIAFGLTSLVRIAQGSATVAMITTISIVSALASDLTYHPVYLALAIGCGSKPIPWMNDSGFWIISRMSGMSVAETLKTASAMMSLMGVVGLVVVMLGAWLLPMA